MSDDKHEARVLLVDDDENVRLGYAKVLRRFGFETETAADGHEAAERLSGQSFDVIVSDLSMPNMDGLEFLRTVRRHDLDIPVVLMTGQPELETALRAIEYGAFRYLPKPVDLDELALVLRRAVSMHQLAKLKRQALELVGSEGRLLGDHASLDARFTSALEKLWMAYQPIVHWPERAVFAYEALVRSAEPSLPTPADLLDAAERLGRVHELGRHIRHHVARDAADAPASALLFINLHPLDLNDAELYSSGSPLAASAARVVLEITERSSLHAVSGLKTKVHKLRHLGFRIAVDDLGAGYAGLASFSQLEPEIVKLDISLVRGVDASTKKQSVIRALAGLCKRDLQIQVVSEGVESRQEQEVLARLGCDLMQGYLFAKPDRGFLAPRW